VLASYGDRTVMGTTLEATLAALFKGEAASPTVTAKSAETLAAGAITGPAPLTAAAGVSPSAAEHYGRALEALKAGDWTRFGSEMQALGDELNRPPNSAAH